MIQRLGYASLKSGKNTSLPLIQFEFRGKIALVSSFGTEAAILLHMVSEIDRSTDIVFIDTGKLFTLTHQYREHLTDLFGLTSVKTQKPSSDDLQSHDPSGTLWETNVDKCCEIRRIRPLNKALGQYRCWITGRKPIHGGERSNLAYFELVEGQIKVNPLAALRKQHINFYYAKHKIPPHPLVDRGFLSVGCHHCSAPADDPNDPRSGRWKGLGKAECGIQT